MKGNRQKQPHKIELVFFRSEQGDEPVRSWLRGLPDIERQEIGRDLLRAQWRWPVGMPLCRPMRDGLWEIRTNLRTGQIARVLVCVFQERLVALHGFIKKSRTTPDSELGLARKRRRALEDEE